MKGENKLRSGIKLRKNMKMLTTPRPSLFHKKKKQTKTTRKKDEENILSKDIDVDEEMKEFERLGEKRINKTREGFNQPANFTLKN